MPLFHCERVSMLSALQFAGLIPDVDICAVLKSLFLRFSNGYGCINDQRSAKLFLKPAFHKHMTSLSR